MSSWSFHNPTRIIFGENTLDSIREIVSADRAILVTTPGFRKRGLVDSIEERMGSKLVRTLDIASPNPSLDDLVKLQREDGLGEADAVIALGGGSSIDLAKALSRLIASSTEGPLSDGFWSGGLEHAGAIIPITAIPTTAGTGSEVTPTATIWDHKKGIKRSLYGEDLYPRVAVLDPSLTYDLPLGITVSSGLDAISHALESIWSRRASPMSIVLAMQSLKLSMVALPRLEANRRDIQARHAMMRASLMAGLSISQTRTALSHSISYPLTLEFDVPHGVACSFALPEVLEFNAEADDGRLMDLANELGHASVAQLTEELRRLTELLLSNADFIDPLLKIRASTDITKRMFTKGRSDNNLRAVELDDVEAILSAALSRYSVQ